MPEESETPAPDKWSQMFKKAPDVRYSGAPLEPSEDDEVVPLTEVVLDVVQCPRCDYKHTEVVYHKFTRPVKHFTHWAVCPRTDEPIFIYLEQGETKPPKTPDRS